MKNEFFLRKLSKLKSLLESSLSKLESFGKKYKHAIPLVAATFIFPTFVLTVFTFLKNNETSPIAPVVEIDNNEDASEVKGEFNNNEYESRFNDKDWEIKGQWEKNEKTLICEPNPITERDGGPKMTNINYSAFNNFRMKVEFVPKSNSDEINFVIYIGNSYRMVLGDGNRKFFYIKQGDNFISEINKDFKGPIELENKIRFDKPVEIEIIQRVLSNTNIASVDVIIKYFPKENYNTESFPENFHFQVNNDSFYNNGEKIILGLLCEKNTVTAKLNHFYLKNN